MPNNKTRHDIKTLDDLYPRLFLIADDLGGKPARAYVERVEIKEFWNDREKANEPHVVLYFHNKARHLICNKTQSEAMAEISGTRTIADWVGHTVRLVPAIARNKKATIDLEAVQPAPATQPAPTPDDDEDDTENPYILKGDELERTEKHRTAGNQ